MRHDHTFFLRDGHNHSETEHDKRTERQTRPFEYFLFFVTRAFAPFYIFFYGENVPERRFERAHPAPNYCRPKFPTDPNCYWATYSENDAILQPKTDFGKQWTYAAQGQEMISTTVSPSTAKLPAFSHPILKNRWLLYFLAEGVTALRSMGESGTACNNYGGKKKEITPRNLYTTLLVLATKTNKMQNILRNAYILSTSDTISTCVTLTVCTHGRAAMLFCVSIYPVAIGGGSRVGLLGLVCLDAHLVLRQAKERSESNVGCVGTVSNGSHKVCTRCERANNKRYTNDMNEPQHTIRTTFTPVISL